MRKVTVVTPSIVSALPGLMGGAKGVTLPVFAATDCTDFGFQG